MPVYAEIAGMFDHAILSPTQTLADLERECGIADKYRVASVCVKPYAVAPAASFLRDSVVDVGTVIGFPHGGNDTAVKVAEATLALEAGAAEVDMVVNIGQVLGGNWTAVEADIRQVNQVAQQANACLKVIFENCYLDQSDKVRLCEICTDVGVDFVKTSTGFGTGGATLDDCRLMRAHTPPEMGVKASGGIRNLDAVLAYHKIGVSRIGASATATILDEFVRRFGAAD